MYGYYYGYYWNNNYTLCFSFWLHITKPTPPIQPCCISSSKSPILLELPIVTFGRVVDREMLHVVFISNGIFSQA